MANEFVLINIVVELFVFSWMLVIYFIYRKITPSIFALLFLSLFYPLGGVVQIVTEKCSIIGTCLISSPYLLGLWFIFFAFVGFMFLGYHISYVLYNRSSCYNYTSVKKYDELKFIRPMALILASVGFSIIFFKVMQIGPSEYFRNIDYYRTNMSGMSIVNLLVFLSAMFVGVLISNKNWRNIISFSILVLLFSTFIITGYRGNVIAITLYFFFIFQLNTKIFKINAAFIAFVLVSLVAFLAVQAYRSGEQMSALSIFDRFFGYDVLEVVWNKVVDKGMFSFDTISSSLEYVSTYIIPRGLYPDKIEPISYAFAGLFSDVGDRDLSTGGISTTIIGFWIWNLGALGILIGFFVGVLFCFLDQYFSGVKRATLSATSKSKVAMLSVYSVLMIEAPANFFLLIWVVLIFSILAVILTKNRRGPETSFSRV